MKTPRVEDFDPNAKKEPVLKSPLDDMPVIEKPKATSKNAGMPANQNASKPASQTSGNPALQHCGRTNVPHHITATEKVTYRFHSEGKYAVEDMKTILARKHGIKSSLEEIAEESILITYEDLLENQNASKLANRLSRTPENKKSS